MCYKSVADNTGLSPFV